MTCGDRGMGREDRRCPDGREGLIEIESLCDVFVDAVQDNESGMSFVQVPCGRRDAERAEGADAADPEDDFLLQPRFAIAAVETRRQVAILRSVLFEAGVEQVQVDAAYRHLPDVGQHGAVA